MNYVTIQSYTVDVLLVYGVLRESIQEQTVNHCEHSAAMSSSL